MGERFNVKSHCTDKFSSRVKTSDSFNTLFTCVCHKTIIQAQKPQTSHQASCAGEKFWADEILPHNPFLWQDKLGWLELWPLGWKASLPKSILKVSHHSSGFPLGMHSKAEGGGVERKAWILQPLLPKYRGGCQGFQGAILPSQVLWN